MYFDVKNCTMCSLKGWICYLTLIHKARVARVVPRIRVALKGLSLSADIFLQSIHNYFPTLKRTHCI